MRIMESHIVSWKEIQFGEIYFTLCKVHICASHIGFANEQRFYIREYDNGKMLKMVVITKEEFFEQIKNPI